MEHCKPACVLILILLFIYNTCISDAMWEAALLWSGCLRLICRVASIRGSLCCFCSAPVGTEYSGVAFKPQGQSVLHFLVCEKRKYSKATASSKYPSTHVFRNRKSTNIILQTMQRNVNHRIDPDLWTCASSAAVTAHRSGRTWFKTARKLTVKQIPG